MSIGLPGWPAPPVGITGPNWLGDPDIALWSIMALTIWKNAGYYMLFFLAGSVKDRFHTLEIRRLGGLLIQAPKMGWVLGLCVMASLGLPGLAGFWGEFPAILSAYNPAEGLKV